MLVKQEVQLSSWKYKQRESAAHYIIISAMLGQIQRSNAETARSNNQVSF